MAEKTSEKKPKNQFFVFFLRNFHDYIEIAITYDTLPCTSSLVQISKESDSIWGSYTQKTTHKQPKIYFSGPTKTFGNS